MTLLGFKDRMGGTFSKNPEGRKNCYFCQRVGDNLSLHTYIGKVIQYGWDFLIVKTYAIAKITNTTKNI